MQETLPDRCAEQTGAFAVRDRQAPRAQQIDDHSRVGEEQRKLGLLPGSGGRRGRRAAGPRKLTAKLWDLIVSKLRLRWSPGQFVSWLKARVIASIGVGQIYPRLQGERAKGSRLDRKLRGVGAGASGAKPPTRPGLAGFRSGAKSRSARRWSRTVAGWANWRSTRSSDGHQGALVGVVQRVSKYTRLLAVANKPKVLARNALVSAGAFRDLCSHDRGRQRQGARGSPPDRRGAGGQGVLRPPVLLLRDRGGHRADGVTRPAQRMGPSNGQAELTRIPELQMARAAPYP